ncbi:hypothetical protein BDK51DRAFT_43006 [Blyttiomyces helicus]|uniref:Uncharacterized protein n=1 Tax=Blyttiomyces helicus TaxID=388810 RepID=A0A4P9WM68_9FUNG|nr:hypothetical protein BDK51DRAFT_43006 [Blyttiomyces helicus]|eukprot:RKO94161.1 hypothetical protein BDK51DRAFT_43006 [Blyttiomyces helicus]
MSQASVDAFKRGVKAKSAWKSKVRNTAIACKYVQQGIELGLAPHLADLAITDLLRDTIRSTVSSSRWSPARPRPLPRAPERVGSCHPRRANRGGNRRQRNRLRPAPRRLRSPLGRAPATTIYIRLLVNHTPDCPRRATNMTGRHAGDPIGRQSLVRIVQGPSRVPGINTMRALYAKRIPPEALALLEERFARLLHGESGAVALQVRTVDGAVPPAVRDLLAWYLDAIAAREVQDFHPGSEGKVQDLIHPSLDPLVEGHTRL